MTLSLAYESAVASRAAFDAAFRQDAAESLGVGESAVAVIAVSAGSTVVDFSVVGAADAASRLRDGGFTTAQLTRFNGGKPVAATAVASRCAASGHAVGTHAAEAKAEAPAARTGVEAASEAAFGAGGAGVETAPAEAQGKATAAATGGEAAAAGDAAEAVKVGGIGQHAPVPEAGAAGAEGEPAAEPPLDSWGLRMERVDAIIAAAENGDGVAAGPGGGIQGLRSEVGAHCAALLEEPARLCVHLARVTLRSLGAGPAWSAVQYVLELMLDAERRLRQAHAALVAAGKPPPSGYSRDHNAQLLLALRGTARYLARAAVGTSLGLRDLYVVTCVAVGGGGFCRLGLQLATAATGALRAAVTEESAPRLALVACEVRSAFALGGSPSEQAAASRLFTASAVWAALAAARLRRLSSDPALLESERLVRRGEVTSLFPRLWPCHLRDLLVGLDATDLPGPAARAAVDVCAAAPIAELEALLEASLPHLRAFALQSLADRLLAPASSSAKGGSLASGAGDSVACLSAVRRRWRRFGTLRWLQGQAARSCPGEGSAAAALLGAWVSAGGDAQAEAAVLLAAAADPRDAPAPAALALVVSLFERWRAELCGRGEAVEACGAGSVGQLLDRAARAAAERAWSNAEAPPPLGSEPLDPTVGDACRRAAMALVGGIDAVPSPAAHPPGASRVVVDADSSAAALDERLDVLAALLRVWGARIDAPRPVPLAAEWDALLSTALRVRGPRAVLRLRAAAHLDGAPVMGAERDEALRVALAHAVVESSRPGSEAPLACVKLALYSRHGDLAERALQALAPYAAGGGGGEPASAPTAAAEWAFGGPTPAADAELALLLLRRGLLGRLGRTPYWPLLEPAVAGLPGTAFGEALGALCEEQLYEAAGGALLRKSGTHRSLVSTAAKLDALQRHLRAQHSRAET